MEKMKMEKIGMFSFLSLIFLGATIANVQIVCSTVSSNSQSIMQPVAIAEERIHHNVETFELDYQLLKGISDYLFSEATYNSFKITAISYSAALLFEGKNALIIIGHGYYNSKGQYFIGDFSEENIQMFAEEKELVALLACYSAEIDLTAPYQLKYRTRIDLLTAINDLCNFLGWHQKNAYLPVQNLYLFDLDPGQTGPSDFVETNFFNDAFYAYAYHHLTGVYTTWNLKSASAIKMANDYLATFQKAVIFIVGSGDFTVRYVRTYLFGLITEVETSYEYHEFKCRAFSKEVNGDLIIRAYDFIADDTYKHPNDPTFELSIENFVEALGTESVNPSDLIKAAGVLATIGSAFFAGGIAATLKYGSEVVFATVFGIPLSGSLLISIGLVIYIICVVILVIALIDDSPHTFIILESG